MSKNSIFLLKKRSLKGKESDMRQLAK
ncbi:transcriptional regulator, partial [Streptococcus pneumoniae]